MQILFTLLILLLTFLSNLPPLSAEEDDTSFLPLHSEPLGLALGCVNVINGDFCQNGQEFSLPGGTSFSWCYSPLDKTEHPLGLGVANSLFSEVITTQGKHRRAFLRLGGAYIKCRLRKIGDQLHGSVDYELFSKYGYTNYNDLMQKKNHSLKLLRLHDNGAQTKKERRWTVTLPDGTIQIYKYECSEKSDTRHYPLAKEKLPNGTIRTYTYNDHHDLHTVTTYSSDRKTILDTVTFNYFDDKVVAIASNGVTTHFQKKGIKEHLSDLKNVISNEAKTSHVIESITASDKPRLDFKFQHHGKASLFNLIEISHPTRNLLLHYGSSSKIKNLEFEDRCNGQKYKLGSFLYTDDSTTVIQGGYKTIYRHSEKRINAKNDGLREWCYFWDSGRLTGMALKNQQEQYLTATCFSYDACGNVIKRQQYGQLTGKELKIIPHTSICSTISPFFEAEPRTTEYIWETGRFNLLKKEILPNGSEIHYSYKRGTDLLASKLIFAEGQYQLREFYEYDRCGTLIKKICDDGSQAFSEDLTDVTYRFITYTTPRLKFKRNGHMQPKEIAEYYLDQTGQEKLLRRTLFEYQKDLLTKEGHYDAQNALRFTLFRKYNTQRQLISETNPLSIETRYAYDQNFKPVLKEVIGSGKKSHCLYNFLGQCVAEQEEHPDGKDITRYRYNDMGHCLSRTDPFDQTTQFAYDRYGRQILEENPLGHHSSKKYDLLNHEIATIDYAGNTTLKSYTCEGEPLEICYPDGTKEQFAYTLSGNLETKWERNGSYTHYTYDYLNRQLTAHTYSEDGTLIHFLSRQYKGQNLLSETDLKGTTTYRYDRAARRIFLEKEGRTTQLAYDSLGRISQAIDEESIKYYLYDLLNRVIEERVKDLAGNLLSKKCMSYDIHGNLTTEKIYTDHENFIQNHTEFDSRSQPILHIDPLGNVTRFTYLFSDHLEKLITAPDGTQLHEVYNALGQLIQKRQLSPFGVTLSLEEIAYDPMGRKILQTNHRIQDGASLGKQEIAWRYDGMGQLLAQKEHGQHETTYYYNRGRLDTVTKPGGTTLSYRYDLLGHLSELISSDGTIHYRYQYDACHNLLKSEDLIQSSNTSMAYDAYHRLKQESLANGLTMTYAHDTKGRLQCLTLPDQSQIAYVHQALSLAQVKRLKDGKESYSCTYQHDLAGHPTTLNLLNTTIEQSFDPCGRTTAVRAPHYHEEVSYNAVGNVTHRKICLAKDVKDLRYRYDGLLQLTEENGHCYGYDSLQNRLHKDGQPHQFNPLNQLLESPGESFTYDACGNLIAREKDSEKTTYSYDALNRLTALTTSTQQALYRYDAQNRRISKELYTLQDSKWQHKTTVHYLYQGQNEIGAYQNGRLTQLRLLGHGKGAEIGATVAMELDDCLYAPIHDCQNNICALLDPVTNQLVEGYRFTAFGEEEQTNVLNPWRYSSKRYDAESGLYHFGRRYYDPGLGRWLTTDPLGYLAGPNPYSYVLNRPLTHLDHYGLFPALISSLLTKTAYTLGARLCYKMINRIPNDFLHTVSKAAYYLAGANKLSGNWLVDLRNDPGGCVAVVGDPGAEDIGLSANGMGNTLASSIDNATQIAEQAGVRVSVVYNNCHGFLMDIAKFAILRIGFKLPCVQEMAQAIQERLALDPDHPLLVTGHSLGALVIKRALELLPPELRARVHAYTYGPAQAIEQGEAAIVKNYASNRDLLALILNPWESIKAFFGMSSNLELLPSQGPPFVDHEILGDTYSGRASEDYYLFSKRFY